MDTAIFLFRRDLRLEDNTGLIAALQTAKQVIPVFCFDPRQVGNNKFKGEKTLQFMGDSLKDLNKHLEQKGSQLTVMQGKPQEVIQQIHKTTPFDAVFVNRDYTPFAIKRDEEIKKTCDTLNVEFRSYADYLLTEPEQIGTADGSPYKVYSPFARKARTFPTRSPQKNTYKNYMQKQVIGADIALIDKYCGFDYNLYVRGGSTVAQKLLKSLDQYRGYNEQRNFPAIKGTTGLSAHHKFGTVSMREVFHQVVRALGEDHGIVNELYWRDFFTHIGYHFPHVFGNAFHEHYNNIKWENNSEYIEAWKKGETGFPIVDAGMKELVNTGYMHNRVRMIVASFLTKDLLVDWKVGEQFFAQHLIDYDPSVNNGNWQWAASTGCDAQPYFRIFNPWLQQERFDKECVYIKRWLPILQDVPAKSIHNIHKQHLLGIQYPKPIVEHSVQKDKAKTLFKR